MAHYKRFAQDERLGAIRINSAMMFAEEMEGELSTALSVPNSVPTYFDLKGRQLRIRAARKHDSYYELELNHPISVDTPTSVLFKGGTQEAMLFKIEPGKEPNDPQRLIVVPDGRLDILIPGESLVIRDDSFKVLGKFFPDYEIERIKLVASRGWTKYVLSYVESQRDIDMFREYVGNDVEVVAKIESRKGLEWVARGFKPQDNLRLMTARGDLYIEVPKPHEMLEAQRLIVEKDPHAVVGSRILLTCCKGPVPEANDFSELAWLYDIGYRTMMLCDDLCIDETLLARAINVFDAFRSNYADKRHALLSATPSVPAAPPSKSSLVSMLRAVIGR